MKNVNQGHRARLRERMLAEGLQSFKDHEVLELLLCQYLPRKDTNKLAHRLIDKFGSFAAVLNATPQQLMQVEGVAEVTACNLAMLKEVFFRYKREKQQPNKKLTTVGAILRYAKGLIAECPSEQVLVLHMDRASRVAAVQRFDDNSVDGVNVSCKDIVATALRVDAGGVAFFHCHPDGLCQPSREDFVFTERLFAALAHVNVALIEHCIFNNGNQFYSFLQAGVIKKLQNKYEM